MQCFIVEVAVAFFFATSPSCHVTTTWTTHLDSQLYYGF